MPTKQNQKPAQTQAKPQTVSRGVQPATDTPAPTTPTPAPAAPAQTWSETDEALYQSLVARRRAAKRDSTVRARATTDDVLLAGRYPAGRTGSALAVIRGVVDSAGEGGIKRSALAEAVVGKHAALSSKAKAVGWIAGAVRRDIVTVRGQPT
jgi:hypothetical protein